VKTTGDTSMIFICLSKLLKDFSRAAEKKLYLPAALEYLLLVHRNLLEYSSGHLKILFFCVKCNFDFEEISNKYYFSIMFST
jgi:hypothetical protein